MEVLNKSQFMSKVINDYYKKRLLNKQKSKEIDDMIITRMSKQKDKKMKRRI